jgi:N utilization substance protein B
MVDRAIMRLALYEINALDTPNVVVVDEAIELAKRFSTQDAAKFINGILGAYIKSLDTNHV